MIYMYLSCVEILSCIQSNWILYEFLKFALKFDQTPCKGKSFERIVHTSPFQSGLKGWYLYSIYFVIHFLMPQVLVPYSQ